MALVIPFPRVELGAAQPRGVRFRPEARSALAALGYALPGVAVQFCADGTGDEWAVVGPAAHAAIWFSIYPGAAGDLVLRDARMRFVGRYQSGSRLRAALQPLARNLALLCELPESWAH